jgi:predicted ATPase/class 3 adenylate cyclase
MADQPTGTVTLLFTDIEGSTRMLERLGPQRYGEALQLHRRLLRTVFQRHAGYEVDYEGDAFFVAFPRAQDAVAAATEGQQALAAAEWPEGLPIRVRMGLHTGEPVAMPPKYLGLDVHKAARIMAAGHGGQVLISATTQRAADGAKVVPLGEHRLKDLLQPEPLYQLRIPGLPSEFPVLKTLGNRPTNLPVQPNPLIGREHEVAELTALLRDPQVRLMTLTGPGGIGKTRLALQVGAELLDDFRSGVFFVSLAPIRDPALVISAIAQALAVHEVPGEEPADTLASYVEQKQMLLVLDNLEHVIDAAVDVAAMLGRCAQVKVLVTSRERLRLRDERVYAVPPLPVVEPDADVDVLLSNDAVALFAARAHAATGEFELDTESAAVVAAICARLDGLPLAIELAAGRISVFPPEALLRRLDRRLQVLVDGARDLAPRQRTLRETIAWSYELLHPAEQLLFAVLGIFDGGCRLDAAEAMCHPHEGRAVAVVDQVFSLVEKNLLRRRADPDGEPRFVMFETLREFAQQQLGDDGQAARGAHARHYATVVRQLAPGLRTAELPSVVARLAPDEPNIRTAFSTLIAAGDSGAALRFASGLLLYWYIRGRPSEAISQLRSALALPGGAAIARTEALNHLALALAMVRADPGAVAEAAAEAEQLAREHGDDAGIAFALNNRALALAAMESPDARRALQLLQEALNGIRGNADKWVEALILTNLGFVRFLTGDMDAARELMLEVDRNYRCSGINPPMYAMSLANLGGLEISQGNRSIGIRRLADAIRAAQAIGMIEVVVSSLEVLVAALAQTGNHAEAARLAGGAEQLWAANETTTLQAYERTLATQSRAMLQTVLGDETFEALRASGKSMTFEAAVARALIAAAANERVQTARSRSPRSTPPPG